jgi:two-component system, OmpR family, sensor histidine kinase VicK
VSSNVEYCEAPATSGDGQTKIVYGTDDVMNQILQFFPKIKERYDSCTDSADVAVFVRNQPLWHQYISLKKRSVRLRFLTDVTTNNISYCKEYQSHY